MYEFVVGGLSSKNPLRVVVECGGIGYSLTITLHTYQNLPEVGNNVKLYTHLVHRDDIMELFGFITTDERELFRKLIGVTRVGPKLAISILSGTTSQKLAIAIAHRDIFTLSKIPKVGKKTAERIILELREKIKITDSMELTTGDETTLEAVKALMALGFNYSEAEKAILKAKKEKPEASTDELIKLALQR